MKISHGGLFLSINGAYKPSLDYMGRMEIVSYHIASGNIDEDLLQNLLVDIVSGKDYDENLKLDLYNAILN